MTVVAADRVFGHPDATALLIERGRIVAIGTADELSPAGGPMRRTGGVILPAFRDSHIHPVDLALADGRLDLGGVRSFAELRDAVREHAAGLRLAEPLVAVGLDDERLEEGRMPTRHDLDAVLAARPILVYRHCSHVAVANSLALSIAGLDDAGVDPVGGRLRRAASGEITGVLEEAAIGAVSTVLAADLPPPSDDDLLAALLRLRRRGIVAVDAMVSSGTSMWCSGVDEIGLLCSIADRSPVEIAAFVISSRPDELTVAARRLEADPGRVRFAGWKGFADGSLGGRTADLRRPYADDPATSGLERTPTSELAAMAETAVGLGGLAAIHAIGDRAVDRAIGIAERLGPGTVRIEHASVADPEQVSRMAAVGAIASVQPSFVTSDQHWIERRLGEQRSEWAYPFRSMLAAGMDVRGGSDAPIEAPDPFVGMADAMRERKEALDPAAAVQMFAESRLEAGAPATFVVAERAPDHTTPDELALSRVHAVWMNGKRVE